MCSNPCESEVTCFRPESNRGPYGVLNFLCAALSTTELWWRINHRKSLRTLLFFLHRLLQFRFIENSIKNGDFFCKMNRTVILARVASLPEYQKMFGEYDDHPVILGASVENGIFVPSKGVCCRAHVGKWALVMTSLREVNADGREQTQLWPCTTEAISKMPGFLSHSI